MRRKLLPGGLTLLLCVLLSLRSAYAQLPANVLVGYHENWRNLRLTQAHANYNVICLAFALDPTNNPGYNLSYTRPPAYANDAAMMADIDVLHSQGKIVLLSIGGATGPIRLSSAAQQTTFQNSINAIFTRFGNKIDGLDIDLETTSLAFGSTWTMSSPAAGQTYMVNAIKNIMSTYQTTNGKKMILTMAPEVVYLMGGLSTWQVANVNGGAFLPILDGLRNELDLIHMQLYNAGGASGGVYAWDGNLYYDDGNMNFALAMNESLIKGFTLVSGKGTFVGIPSSKIAFGFPASTAPSAAGSGYVTPAKICDGVKYFRGAISKPGTVSYTMSAYYADMKGLMTWSIDEDYAQAAQWSFAIGYSCTMPMPVTFVNFQVTEKHQMAQLSWQTVFEQDADYFSVQKSYDGVTFHNIGQVDAAGNSSQLLSYSYTDPEPLSDITYYRIKETDFNGDAYYSDIKAINKNGIYVQAYPNPSAGAFTVSTSQSSHAVLQSISGTVISEMDITAGLPYHIPAEALPSGVYILSVQAGDRTEHLRLVKE